MKTKFFFFLFSLVYLFLPLSAQGIAAIPNAILQDTADTSIKSTTIFNEWQKEEVLKLKLVTDFDYLLSDKKNEAYQGGEITIHHKTERAYNASVKVKGRGKFRRTICGFPPLKIKLNEESLEGINLQNYKTFKLVTHCQNDGSTKSTILKEYLAYRLYEQITPYSYRTQLVEITYIDQNGRLPSVKRYGFLIEDKDELEDRLNVDVQKLGFDTNIATSEDHLAAARMVLFQFMIGNSDYGLLANRNTKLVKDLDTHQQIPIPYDFDLSGFVNPSYGFPNPDYEVKDLLDRVMLGRGVNKKAIEVVAQEFKDKKEIILETIEEEEHLSKSEKKNISKYLDHFFNLLEQPLNWEYQKVIPYK